MMKVLKCTLATVGLMTAVAHADPPADVVAVAPAAPSAPSAPVAPPPAPTLTRAPDFQLEGTSGARRSLRDFAGRVVILLYEDRDSNQQNNTLKEELGQRARAQDMTRDVAVVPVANLVGFDFWPARGFARDAVVDIARAQGLEILIDWTGSMAASYRFRTNTSYVMVLDREGRVLFRYGGPLNSDQRRRFFSVVGEAMSRPASP